MADPTKPTEAAFDKQAWAIEQVRRDLPIVLADLYRAARIGRDTLLVIGASTSEVVGERIGTATSMAVGQAIVDVIQAFAAEAGCEVAFQCCEHLNRSLVVSERYAKRRGWREVSAIPVPGAGGAVAAAAYWAIADACLVDAVEADVGVDIGDTLIGMHLRPVAVPVRSQVREIGKAHVTMARSRPPLVGGTRAVYDRDEARRRAGLDGSHHASADIDN
ncbi:UPF0340 protein [Alicyclobacillus hesperidum subsp. aegles]|uniref:TIGR01440 family protein n=1 Tax=Alicyclobacillus hesperidum TaxID=89784 RepID=UPI0007193A69|nr:TIGR01440 family protein [Alicyclobacillus hesperidum]KRW92327.1 hypothetical protein SD51_04705 [Alicyclobacillus tengchongensis]GLG02006.1 UPF0340 protein [Alicyclobacillus hesperidum subsp. aegles]